MNGQAIPGEKFNQLWTDCLLLLQQRDRAATEEEEINLE
jgi:hypothetical protein